MQFENQSTPADSGALFLIILRMRRESCRRWPAMFRRRAMNRRTASRWRGRRAFVAGWSAFPAGHVVAASVPPVAWHTCSDLPPVEAWSFEGGSEVTWVLIQCLIQRQRRPTRLLSRVGSTSPFPDHCCDSCCHCCLMILPAASEWISFGLDWHDCDSQRNVNWGSDSWENE